MDAILTKAIWNIRKNIEPNATKLVNLIYTGGKTYQLFFVTQGCHFACSMCNYGFDKPFNVKKAIQEFDEIINNLPEDIEILVLEASGSFLDEREIPKSFSYYVLEKVAKLPNLIFVDIETHYKTVTEEKMQYIQKFFSDSNSHPEFEFGVESANPDVLKMYNKEMNLNELLKTVWKAESYGISSDLNFLVGAPMLTIKEQIEDGLNSVKWAMDNCPADATCVLFPLNIKHNTLVRKLYDASLYELIYHWEFIEVLSNIPEDYLLAISIAWWGNRFNIFDGTPEILFPRSCDECHDAVQKFYSDFYSNHNIEKRVALLHDIKKIDCKCRREFLEKMEGEKQPETSISERFLILRDLVKNEHV